MEPSYELRSITYNGRHLCYELVGVDSDLSELEQWETDSKMKDAITMLYRYVERIKTQGLKSAVRSSKLTPISPKDRLYEVKNFSDVWREMSCIVTENHWGTVEIVLLFGFKGHQGSDSIPAHILKKAHELGAIAMSLLQQGGATNED